MSYVVQNASSRRRVRCTRLNSSHRVPDRRRCKPARHERRALVLHSRSWQRLSAQTDTAHEELGFQIGMAPIDIALVFLLIHALLGAVDTFYNHEWVERLPQRAEAHDELRLHALRSATFVALFLGAAWFDWHGAWWIVLPILIGIEYIITLFDSIEEDRYRRLKPAERVNHMLLGLNTGVYAALIVDQGWTDWRLLPSSIEPVSHGVLSWLLTLCGVAVAIWAIRDGLAAHDVARVMALIKRGAFVAEEERVTREAGR